MEDEQIEIDFQKIINADQINYSQGSEEFNLINSFTDNLSNLPNLIQKIPLFQGNIRHLSTIFNLIEITLDKKGSFLNLESLLELVDNFFSKIDDLTEEITLNQGTTTMCSKVSAYLYRFIFEILIDTPPSFEPVFNLISNPSESKIILGLNMMISIVDIMKKQMKHVPFKTKNSDISKEFKRTQLINYFKAATDHAFDLHSLITPVSINLMISIFNFLMNKKISIATNDFESSDYELEIPEEIFGFYHELNITESLFNVFQEMKLTESIDCISYISSASKNSWKTVGITPISFINSIEENLTEILQSTEKSDDKETFSITKLIYKLGKLISLSFDDDPKKTEAELSPNFIPTIHQYSLSLFENISVVSNTCYNLLYFWKILFNNRRFIQNNEAELSEMYQSIFQEYISCLLASISTDLEMIPDLSIFIENCTPLLSICKLNLVSSSNFLNEITSSILSNIEENNLSTYLHLSVIVLIITSFFSENMNNIIQDDKSSILFFSFNIQLIFEIIEKTNEIQENLIQFYELNSTILESSLVQFSSRLMKKLITSPILYSNEILDDMKTEKKQIFDLFVNRFLNDLMVFISFPDLLSEIITFFNNLFNQTSKTNLTELFETNEIFNSLVTHQQFIGIDAIDDIKAVYRISSDLNRFYSLAISFDQVNEFLSFFDEQFTSQYLQQFQNPKDALILYRQINGFLKGSKSCNKYTLVWRWVLRKHSNHIDMSITSQSQTPEVIKSILNVMVNLSNGQNLNLPNYSAEGLEMIQLMNKLLLNINQNVKIEDDSFLHDIVKILTNCITTKNANFGIMKLYEDETIDNLASLLFEILKDWPFEEYSKFKSMLTKISNAFNSILRFLPELIVDETNDENFTIIIDFYVNSLSEIRSIQSEFSIKNGEIFTNLTSLIFYFVQNQLFQVWPRFRPIFLSLLNTLLNTYSNVVDCVYRSFFYIVKYDSEYYSYVFESIVDSMEEDLKEEVSEQFKLVFDSISSVEQPNKATVFSSLEKFANKIKKYSIQLHDLPESPSE